MTTRIRLLDGFEIDLHIQGLQIISLACGSHPLRIIWPLDRQDRKQSLRLYGEFGDEEDVVNVML